jgi:arginyl-tRNA synthetase
MYASEKLRQDCLKLVEMALGKDFLRSNEKKIRFEKPPREIDADLAFPCFALSQGKNPVEFAEDMATKINKTIKKGSLVHKVHGNGPYVNFIADSNAYPSMVLKEILSLGEKYGSARKNNKIIIIDYSSPNIAKPMHLGHLRSTIIGQSIYNIYSFLGYKCLSDNHLGDWGTQFGKLIAAYKLWGEEAKLKSGGVEYLTELYVKFHDQETGEEGRKLTEEGREWFRKLEKGDKEATRLWKLFNQLSMEEFSRIYGLLNVRFDLILGESKYYKNGIKIVKESLARGIAEESEGAVIIKLNDEKIPPLVIQKSDESTLYSTRDLACIKAREKYKPEKIIYVIGTSQKLYMKQLFLAAKILGHDSEFVHVDFGTVTMEGGKMSTRQGKFVLLNDLIEESVKRAEKIMEEKNPGLKKRTETAKMIGIGSIIFNDLKQERIKDIDFDWGKALNFEGDSCPYLQYAYVRTRSIIEKSKKLGKKNVIKKSGWEPEEIGLAKKLAEFPQVIESSASQYKPNLLAQYLLETASVFNEFYNQCKVIGSERESERKCLVMATGVVLKNGLKLLNIEVPEKM